jgi:hypothetical protein
MWMYAAMHPQSRAGKLVSMGGPLRWVHVHPLLRIAFASPALVGALPFRGTRKLCELALPLLLHVPALLSIYMHPDIIDMSTYRELVRVVEDPNRFINRDIAVWMKQAT